MAAAEVAAVKKADQRDPDSVHRPLSSPAVMGLIKEAGGADGISSDYRRCLPYDGQLAFWQQQAEEDARMRKKAEAQVEELQKQLQQQVDEAEASCKALYEAEKDLGFWKNRAKRQENLRKLAESSASYSKQKADQQERMGKVWREKVPAAMDLRKLYQQKTTEAEDFFRKHWQERLRKQTEESALEWRKREECEESGRKKAEEASREWMQSFVKEESLNTLEKSMEADLHQPEELKKSNPRKEKQAEAKEKAGVLAGEIAWAKKLQDDLKLVDEHLTQEVRRDIDTSLKAGRLHDLIMRKMDAANREHKDPNAVHINIGLLLDASSPFSATLDIRPSEHMASGGFRMTPESVVLSKELANPPGVSTTNRVKTEATAMAQSSSIRSRWYRCQYEWLSPAGYVCSLKFDLSGIVGNISPAGSGVSSATALEARASDKENKPLTDFVWVLADISDDDPRQQGMESFSKQVLSSKSIDNVTEKLSLISAVQSNPESATAWLQLGKSSGNGGRVDNISYDKKACCLKAVELCPQSSDAWIALCESCPYRGSVSVNGTSYDRQACMIKALELNPQNSSAWHLLGRSLGRGSRVTVNGKSHSGKDCSIRAVEADSDNADAWNSLGVCHDGGMVKDTMYSKTECHVQALKIDPDHERSWRLLGCAGWGGIVKGVCYDKNDCFVQVLRLNPKCFLSWKDLGDCGGGTVNGISYDAKQCFLQALQLNPGNRAAKEGLQRLADGDAASS